MYRPRNEQRGYGAAVCEKAGPVCQADKDCPEVIGLWAAASGPCAGQSPGCGKDFRHTVCPCCWSHIQGGCHMESANTGSSQGSTVRSQSGPRRCGCHCSRREHCPFYRGRTLSGRCAACLATWHPIRGWRQRSGFCFSIGGSGSDQWRIGGTPGANAGGC